MTALSPQLFKGRNKTKRADERHADTYDEQTARYSSATGHVIWMDHCDAIYQYGLDLASAVSLESEQSSGIQY